MAKVIRLTESQLVAQIKKIINEQTYYDTDYVEDEEFENKLNSMSDKEKIEYAREIEDLRQTERKLKELLNTHKKDIEAINYLNYLKFDRERRENPKIYLGVGKHAVTKIPYIIGKTKWRKGVKDYDDNNVYVGPLHKFDNNKDHPEAMRIAVQKMKKKLAKKYPIEEPNFELLKHIKDNMQK